MDWFAGWHFVWRGLRAGGRAAHAGGPGGAAFANGNGNSNSYGRTFLHHCTHVYGRSPHIPSLSHPAPFAYAIPFAYPYPLPAGRSAPRHIF